MPRRPGTGNTTRPRWRITVSSLPEVHMRSSMTAVVLLMSVLPAACTGRSPTSPTLGSRRSRRAAQRCSGMDTSRALTGSCTLTFNAAATTAPAHPSSDRHGHLSAHASLGGRNSTASRTSTSWPAHSRAGARSPPRTATSCTSRIRARACCAGPGPGELRRANDDCRRNGPIRRCDGRRAGHWPRHHCDAHGVPDDRRDDRLLTRRRLAR